MKTTLLLLGILFTCGLKAQTANNPIDWKITFKVDTAMYYLEGQNKDSATVKLQRSPLAKFHKFEADGYGTETDCTLHSIDGKSELGRLHILSIYPPRHPYINISNLPKGRYYLYCSACHMDRTIFIEIE